MLELTSHSLCAPASTFPVDFEQAMQHLRGALTNLLAAIPIDPRLPQELSRRLGINKNLAWKVCRIINSTDLYASAPHVPGIGGVRILLRSFESVGAPAEALQAVEAAIDRFEQMIRVHVGDRATLELYLGSIHPDGLHSTQLGTNRRNAYLGTSVMWGVQARLDLTLRLIAPNAEQPDRADMCSIGGLLGFRRLRPTASWPVLRQLALGQNLERRQGFREPVDLDSPENEPPLVRSFCSSPLPRTRSVAEEDRTTFELVEGPVGNTAAVDCVFGTIERALVPCHSADADAVGEHYCRIETPVELVQFDVLIHRDLPFEMPPRLKVCSLLHGTVPFPLSRSSRYHVPSRETVQQIGSAPPIIASPHVPRYATLVEQACERLGHPLVEFRGYRMILSYPPLPTVFVMHHPLGHPAGK